MDKLILRIIEDMKTSSHESSLSLEAQVRAYDLLQALTEASEMGLRPSEMTCRQYAEEFSKCEDRLETAYDEASLRCEMAAVLAPLRQALDDARFEAASAAALHEFAKEVFDIWQSGGIFSRRRALRELRARAGFRLESHRIGNYVAKTFDLANEAQVRFAAAQQALFKADVSYKIRPGIYSELNSMLISFV